MLATFDAGGSGLFSHFHLLQESFKKSHVQPNLRNSFFSVRGTLSMEVCAVLFYDPVLETSWLVKTEKSDLFEGLPVGSLG